MQVYIMSLKVTEVNMCLQIEDKLYNPTYPLEEGLTYYYFLFILLLSSPPLTMLWCVCAPRARRVRYSCNINGLLMDYGMVSAGLREREGPPDAPSLLTAWPTQLNYSSDLPSWVVPVLSVSTTRGLRAVCTLLLFE